MKHVCERCGTPLDKHTGLCPNCDADEFVPMSDVEEYEDETVTRKGIIAIFLAIIALLVIVTVIIIAASNGWIGGKEKYSVAKSSYQTYFNETLYSKHGILDTEHPGVTATGMFFADMYDFNNDKSNEFVIGYAEKRGEDIDYKLSCFEYNPNNVIQGADPQGKNSGVEMNSTLTAFSEDDFTKGSTHEENAFQFYYVEDKDKNYIFAERATKNKWECSVYSIDTGSFSERNKLSLDTKGKPSDEDTEKVENFFKDYKLKDVTVWDEDGNFTLSVQDSRSLIFTYSYSQKTDDETGANENVYNAEDYTDMISLLNSENREAVEKASKKNEELLEKENVSVADISFGNVVKSGDYIYYWKYSPSAYSSETSKSGNYKCQSDASNKLIRRSSDGEETVLVETAGVGTLAIAKNRIYFQKANGNSNNYNVDSCDMEGNDVTFHDTGVLAGVAQNGAYVIYSPNTARYDFGTIKAVKTESRETVTTVYNARFLFCDNERVYYQSEQAEYSEAHHGKTTLSSVFANGSGNRTLYVTENDLYETEESYGKTASLIRDAVLLNGYVYYVYGSYSTESDAFRGGKIAKVKSDGSNGEIIGKSEKDYFTVNSSGKLVENDGNASMNGYSYKDGSVYVFNSANGKNEEIISPEDYFSYSQLKINTAESNTGSELLQLTSVSKAGNKLYFTLNTGEAVNSGEGREYRYKSSALFEKDVKSGKTEMIYSVSKSESGQGD